MNDGTCPKCGEELSEYSACACAFAPHYPRAATSSATITPTTSMRAMLEASGRSRNWSTLTVAQRGSLVRLARGANYIHGATAARLLLFGFIREQARDGATTPARALFELTPKGLEALRNLEAERSNP